MFSPTPQTTNMPQAQTKTETSVNFKVAEQDKDQVKCILALHFRFLRRILLCHALR